MAFCQLNYHSNALGKMATANVILPEGNHVPPFPVFYLLHGFGDDHSAWMRRSSIERYAEKYPFIVVMPDGGRGFYLDALQGFAYETAIAHDLVNFIDSRLQTIAAREGRCIGGLSMGGYGALHFALKTPHLFASANSHSGALGFGHDTARWADSPMQAEIERIIGQNSQGSDFDLHALAEKADRASLPVLLIDCGTEDFLIEENRAFHRHLKNHDVLHEYREYSGTHDWEYWDTHVQNALAFHAGQLKLTGGN
jgi:S-formylglutathione hydrolase FrmB